MKLKSIAVVLFFLVCGVLLVILFLPRMEGVSYQSSFCTLRYPKGWTLRESKGKTEAYTQVHVFGERNKDLGFGPSITLTVYPKKDKGGVYASAQALADHAVQAAHGLSSFKLESRSTVKLPFGIDALRCVMTYVLRLPIYQVNAKDVLLKEETYYFEKGDDIYVLSYKNIAKDFTPNLASFRMIKKSIRIK
ncbi:hypothetical protein BU251_07725 [Candidatus Velamenicoccus archaeovorus]|uniref:PsbP C-terminal domain-containing protein n=1 Tax=Velamenicoccus archaeovorus TaxID=1930593 RepID=A0A410P630_VELA1|nr:hypothetical protein [Candidatus Velamenicoccus archaeovorus]QAT17613.1 hypothetical protein BU251_07725 [Candidatus Velamenicoccus archaeovorus]